MSYASFIRLAALTLSLALKVDDAAAQVPPHYPGSICFTPQFWCWANPPGPPGTFCGCPSPYGFIQGTRG